MGILSHAWDVATSFMPMGGVINKLGRMGADYVKSNPGIIGKVGKAILPESVANKVSNFADTLTKEMPKDSKVRGAIKSINNELKGKTVKQESTFKPNPSVATVSAPSESTASASVYPKFINRPKKGKVRSKRRSTNVISF
jgi:hypothetical protein